MRDAGLADTARLTDALARELAVRSSVRTILSGSILPVAAGRYSIVLRVADADSGRTLLTVTGAATDRDLMQAAQATAREVREGLGERRSAIEATARSYRSPRLVPAYRDTSRPEHSASGATSLPATGCCKSDRAGHRLRAAWAGLRRTTRRCGIWTLGWASAEALRRPDRLSEAEHYRLEADAAYALRYEFPAAVRWYD